MKERKEFFTSRLGLMLSLMAVAVGAGNIWRFSRIVAQNGGGSFLIPWVVFLFIWSIPMIITELALGKLTRQAPLGAITQTAGKRFGWMGAFISLTTAAILFYYSVIVGWSCRYFLYGIQGTLATTTDYAALWDHYTQSFQPLLTHLFAVAVGIFVIHKGVVKGIERTNKIILPALCVMIIIIAARVFTLPGSGAGLRYLFTPHWQDLLSLNIWIEALTQNAWDTGAGWGLMLVYANFARSHDGVNRNGAWIAVANNILSLIMAMIIFGAVFACCGTGGLDELIAGQGSSNVGLTFIYLPAVFNTLPGGALFHSFFGSLFFLAFFCAALGSMISMLEASMKALHELGLPKKVAIYAVAGITLLLGAPSALNMAVFRNQDWVWSLALILNGLFIAFAVFRYGIQRFRTQVVNQVITDLQMGRWYNAVMLYLIPIQGFVLLFWYLYRSYALYGLCPAQIYGLGSIILQWGIALFFLWRCNQWLVKKSITDKMH